MRNVQLVARALGVILLAQTVLGAGNLKKYGEPTSACDTCLLAVHVVDDLMCDPYLATTVVDWASKNICTKMQDKASCKEVVKGLTPAILDWLRINANPDQLCTGAGVCANQASLTTKRPLPASKNDMTCPICMFLITQVKQALGDPTTQEDIHKKSLEACNALPEGMVRDACVSFVNQYESLIFSYISTTEPEALCQMMGSCLDQRLARVRLQPLKAEAVQQLSKMMALLGSLGAVNTPANDNCETCKIVIMELRTMLANPNLQAQLVEYAKDACGLIPSLAAQCQADVDQYAPMVFGMVLAYLQPDAVCQEVKICPPPSGVQQLQQAMLDSHLLKSKFMYRLNKYTTAAQAVQRQAMV